MTNDYHCPEHEQFEPECAACIDGPPPEVEPEADTEPELEVSPDELEPA